MSPLSRRSFMELATALRRDLYPEGVASGDPDSNSVLLWTRRAESGTNLPQQLTVEVAEDEAFRHGRADCGRRPEVLDLRVSVVV